MTRHRQHHRKIKGNSDARLSADPRRLIPFNYEWAKYSGDYLKYIVRPKNGVGRPPAWLIAQEWIITNTGWRFNG